MLAPMPTQKNPATAFGRRLIAIRKARGLTQTQLADLVGVKQSSISYHETEGDAPSGEMLMHLATALKTTVDELLGAAPAAPRRATTPEAGPGLDPRARRYWRRFQRLMELPEKDRRAVFRMLDTMGRAKPPTS